VKCSHALYVKESNKFNYQFKPRLYSLKRVTTGFKSCWIGDSIGQSRDKRDNSCHKWIGLETSLDSQAINVEICTQE
jgi:hypothetical protein